VHQASTRLTNAGRIEAKELPVNSSNSEMETSSIIVKEIQIEKDQYIPPGSDNIYGLPDSPDCGGQPKNLESATAMEPESVLLRDVDFPGLRNPSPNKLQSHACNPWKTRKLHYNRQTEKTFSPVNNPNRNTIVRSSTCAIHQILLIFRQTVIMT
jgi:hypothetical protein